MNTKVDYFDLSFVCTSQHRIEHSYISFVYTSRDAINIIDFKDIDDADMQWSI